MKKIFGILVMATMLAMMATAVAQIPSEAVKENRINISTFEPTVKNPFDPAYVWGNPYAVALSGTSPAIFQNIAFKKSPGGISAASYTESINKFLAYDPDGGKSNITVNAAKVGLTAKTAYVGSSVKQSAVVPQTTAAPQIPADALNATI